MANLNNIIGRGKFLILSLLTGLALFAGSQTEIDAADEASIAVFQKLMDDPKVTTKINMTNTKGKKYYVAFASYPIGTELPDGESPSGHAFVCFVETDANGKMIDFATKGFEADPRDPAWKKAHERAQRSKLLAGTALACVITGVPGVVRPVPLSGLKQTENMLITEVNKTQYNAAKKVCSEWDGKRNYQLLVTDCEALAIDVARKLKENKVKIEIPTRCGGAIKASSKLFGELGFQCKLNEKGELEETIFVGSVLAANLKALLSVEKTANSEKLIEEHARRLRNQASHATASTANRAEILVFQMEDARRNDEKAKKFLESKEAQEEYLDQILNFPNDYMQYFREVNTK